jgi:hydroxymethylbilane synthase
MKRVNLGHRCTTPLSSPDLLAAVGQGALGIEIRSGDERVRKAIASIGHWQTEWACGAERALLRVLEGGCSLPVGVETTVTELSHDKAACAPGSGSTPMSRSASNPPYAFPSASPFPALDASSPLLHSSGLLSTSSSPSPGPRKAVIDLTSCVTSLDGSKHVIHKPGPRIVRNWREAEQWGALCAEELKAKGGKEVLQEIMEIRKQREEYDLAVQRAEKAAQA